MLLKAYRQPAPDGTPVEVMIVGFTADGAFGATAVAVYYEVANPSAPMDFAPIAHFRIEPKALGGADASS